MPANTDVREDWREVALIFDRLGRSLKQATVEERKAGKGDTWEAVDALRNNRVTAGTQSCSVLNAFFARTSLCRSPRFMKHGASLESTLPA